MSVLNVNGKMLRTIGFPQGPVIRTALTVIEEHYQHYDAVALETLLKSILENPAAYVNDAIAGEIATMLIAATTSTTIPLKDTAVPYAIFGQDHIEAGALKQMNTAVRLPVAVAGAIMPDAHQGYGLPIGGVLAAENAVIPYGVGVDIGCRMCLSILDLPVPSLTIEEHTYKKELNNHTKFGAGAAWKKLTADPVLERNEFKEIAFVRALLDKASGQLGTSGSGNHFVEWGTVTLTDAQNEWNLPVGDYVALLSHSGSRGLGAQIAGHYTKVAKERCPLPQEAANLAYLDLATEAGQEYWLAMNLAGDYASACHHLIHKKLIAAMGATLLARVENHHNFAWKEMYQGKEVIVHRKGATPAGKGVLGIIPGSMTAPGFIVRGKGEESSLQSASHGAGRQLSRTRAIASIKPHELKQVLQEHGVTLIGGGLDEAPGAYKDIHTVMAAQQQLVEVVGRFQPKLVRMADAGEPRED
ncbi:RtcB family protein [Chitinophaga nivalis]|uniref:3'-phosphate/5'-hydroxy nucleic acid ligase n=1 Tax=Chitinophaga nivalis TaxID=2991709 RepID=A0ABT3IW75_9BACT|nr:RtcB family protein [Chitinophaga nivalis]MCW3462090.1 RtcB family protein [Chitinophaga nivalis]MCW3488218.1 RtcB family protein [Chitinophaga nivalis]